MGSGDIKMKVREFFVIFLLLAFFCLPAIAENNVRSATKAHVIISHLPIYPHSVTEPDRGGKIVSVQLFRLNDTMILIAKFPKIELRYRIDISSGAIARIEEEVGYDKLFFLPPGTKTGIRQTKPGKPTRYVEGGGHASDTFPFTELELVSTSNYQPPLVEHGFSCQATPFEYPKPSFVVRLDVKSNQNLSSRIICGDTPSSDEIVSIWGMNRWDFSEGTVYLDPKGTVFMVVPKRPKQNKPKKQSVSKEDDLLCVDVVVKRPEDAGYAYVSRMILALDHQGDGASQRDEAMKNMRQVEETCRKIKLLAAGKPPYYFTHRN